VLFRSPAASPPLRKSEASKIQTQEVVNTSSSDSK
jgi:hypothetical protein